MRLSSEIFKEFPVSRTYSPGLFGKKKKKLYSLVVARREDIC